MFDEARETVRGGCRLLCGLAVGLPLGVAALLASAGVLVSLLR